jgi:hypothetical protein
MGEYRSDAAARLGDHVAERAGGLIDRVRD